MQNLRISRGALEFELTITGLSGQRRPASEAQLLYSESEASQQRRAAIAGERRDTRGSGRPRRPDKHGRRTLSDLKKSGD